MDNSLCFFCKTKLSITAGWTSLTDYIPCVSCPYYFSRLDPPEYNGYTFEIDGLYYIRADKRNTVIFISKQTCKLGFFVSLDYFEGLTISEIIEKLEILAAFG